MRHQSTKRGGVKKQHKKLNRQVRLNAEPTDALREELFEDEINPIYFFDPNEFSARRNLKLLDP